MSDTELTTLQTTVEARLREGEPEVELLALERPAAERLRLFIDREQGVDLALCERVTRLMGDLLEDYTLEVSSPGPERPLSKPEHFRRFLGHRARLRTFDEIGGRRSFTGRISGADAEQVSVDAPEGEISIPFAALRRSNLLPEDENERAAPRTDPRMPSANTEVRS